MKEKTNKQDKGRLKIGDNRNAISIIALSQNNPLKAIAEFVENSIDAKAGNITIIRGKEKGRYYLKIIDCVQYNAGYLYDIQGRIKTYTMPESSNPEILTYTYNDGGMLNGITSNKDSVNYIQNITYDKNGQRVYMKYGNDSEMSYSYDPVTMLLDRYVIKDGAGTDILDYNYNFDITGNITNITDQIQAGGQNKSVQTYGYDNMGRLTNGTGSYRGDVANLVDAVRNPAYYNVSYSYNSDNRITSQTYKNFSGTPITTMPFNYLSGSHSPDSITLNGSPDGFTKIGFEYDDFGNMKTKKKYTGSGGTNLQETTIFTYDLNKNLTNIYLESGESLEFKYDIKGQRIKKIFKDSDEMPIYSNTYVNGFYTVNNEGGTTKISKHISDGSKIIATKVNNDSSKIMYYHQNHIGSTAMVTDTTGNKFQSYLYMPYGETWVMEKGALYNGDTSDGEIGSDAEIEHLFTGQVFDKESGLYYMNARYYDATVGMFLTPDPMMSGLNHYAYASCNPVMYSDPTGMDDENGGDWDNSEANAIAAAAAAEEAVGNPGYSYNWDRNDPWDQLSDAEREAIIAEENAYYASEEYAISLYNTWNPLNGKDGWSFSGWASAREGNPQTITLGKDANDKDVTMPAPYHGRNLTEKDIALYRSAYIDSTLNKNRGNPLDLVAHTSLKNQSVTFDFTKGQNFYYSRNFFFSSISSKTRIFQ